MTIGELIQALQDRETGQSQWLRDNCPEVFAEQKHLDEGSQERAYWHYGYRVALCDVLRKLTNLGKEN